MRSAQRNAEAFGTGALQIDACRITVADRARYAANCSGDRGHADTRAPRGPKDLHAGGGSASDVGRWPANVLLGHEPDCGPAACAPDCVVRALDELAGDRPAGTDLTGPEPSPPVRRVYRQMGRHAWFSYDDHGGPARFFYSAKTSTAEREAGLQGRLACVDCGRLTSSTHPGPGGALEPCRRNDHPCVKPLELMRWLCRLVTPPGGRVLHPFAGSGTTGAAAALEGLDYLGIEREPWTHARTPRPYAQLARARIAWWATQPPGLSVERILTAAGERLRHQQSGQASIDELLKPADRAA